ncbi:F-box family protein [Rhynchospora pubera]|uniref:F-box family protein n=1 Tax=Rhynchospora pubera TaxID=906938 RepID=A0AAV8EI57_9POAL|nr:F-box family protein [Rhynchospora pubera]
MAKWSELPDDMIEYLTSFLPIQDYHRFSAVCRNWHMVAKQKRHSPAQQIPWLTLGEMKDTKKRKFYNLSEDRHNYLDVPELCGTVLCGSSYGWLFTLDRKLNFRLVNPLTGVCYDLPRPPPYYEGHIEQEMYIDPEELQRCLVFKAILDYDPRTRSDFTALILYGELNAQAFWRAGSTVWTAITDLPYVPDDIAFYEGKFYIVQSPCVDNYSAIYTFEVGTHPKATKLELQVPCRGDPNYIVEDTVCDCTDTDCNCINKCTVNYLVDFGGKLHLVERFLEMSDHRLTTEFVLHELDLERNKYFTCQQINGHAMFLGASSPVVINPSCYHNCMKDAIYFTDFAHVFSESYGAEDLGIYDLIGKSITRYYPRDVIHHALAAPIWFTPNPW